MDHMFTLPMGGECRMIDSQQVRMTLVNYLQISVALDIPLLFFNGEKERYEFQAPSFGFYTSVRKSTDNGLSQVTIMFLTEPCKARQNLSYICRIFPVAIKAHTYVSQNQLLLRKLLNFRETINYIGCCFLIVYLTTPRLHTFYCIES
jgi:hypothetical protein